MMHSFRKSKFLTIWRDDDMPPPLKCQRQVDIKFSTAYRCPPFKQVNLKLIPLLHRYTQLATQGLSPSALRRGAHYSDERVSP